MESILLGTWRPIRLVLDLSCSLIFERSGRLICLDRQTDKENWKYLLPAHPPPGPTTQVSSLAVLTKTFTHWGGVPTLIDTLLDISKRERQIHQEFLRAPYTIVPQPGNSSQSPNFGFNFASETTYHSVLTGTEIAAGLVFRAVTTRPSWTRTMMRQMYKLTLSVYIISNRL